MRQEALAFRLGYITITARYRQRWWFRYGMGVAVIGGVALHLFYRWKTQGWQR